ncbi:hypothetical protein BD779DRAFT_1524660 [Infundibulicybe gibba]|nr:hypothetical protein BD779DRAFT_1524660 [Infundibulicybe gibba]
MNTQLGRASSKQPLSRLLLLSINTGAWTAAFAVASAGIFIIPRRSHLYCVLPPSMPHVL